MSADTTGGQTVPTRESSNDLAYVRTRLGADRTMMAWVRTAISLIGFGFTIFKFFTFLLQSKEYAGNLNPSGPRNFGVALVSMGTFLLLIAMVEHVLFVRRLERESGLRFQRSLALAAALVVTIVGLFLLGNMLFKFGPF